MLHEKRPNVKFSLYLKKAGLATLCRFLLLYSLLEKARTQGGSSGEKTKKKKKRMRTLKITKLVAKNNRQWIDYLTTGLHFE